MTQHNFCFWLTPLDEEIFRCVFTWPKGTQFERLDVAGQVWEALLPFGHPMTLHPTTGETPEKFSARRMTYYFFARTPDGHEFKVDCASVKQAQTLWDLFHSQGYYLPARP